MMAPHKKSSRDPAASQVTMEENLPPLRRPKCVSVVDKTMPALEEKVQSSNREPSNGIPRLLDPNTMKFTQILVLIHPKLVTNYLERILNFLLDNNNELSFLNITPFKRAFLERLITDQNNLKCSKFDANARAIATRIHDVLLSKQQLFQCIHLYENKVLYYKKHYLPKNDTNFKHPSSVPPNQLHANNKQIQAPNENAHSSIPTNFKIQWLNTTLKFVKDDSLNVLDYPEMPVTYADFLHTLINKPELGQDKYGYKSIYAPLWEAMKILSLKFEFRMIYKPTYNKSTASLLLQKIPKNSIKFRSTSQNRDPSPQIKRPKEFLKLQKKQELIESLPIYFITETLKSLVEFAETETMASIPIRASTPNEIMFLTNIANLAKNVEKQWIFPATCRNLIKRFGQTVKEAKDKKLWRLVLNWKIINKKNREKMAYFKKVPKENQQPINFKISEVKPKVPEESPRIKFLKALCIPVDSLSDNSVTTNDEDTNRTVERSREPSLDSQTSNKCNTNVNQNNSKTRDQSSSRSSIRSSSSDRRTKKPVNFLTAGDLISQQVDQPARSVDQPIQPILPVKSKSSDKLPNMSRAKQKIFEAMSTPIDSDKGMRMMKLMGWSGGALGARGEGITEPIMPALQIKSGAGLGHIPEPPKPQKAKKDKQPPVLIKLTDLDANSIKAHRAKFRIIFLKHLLEHIKSDSADLTIEFDKISNKDANFVKNVLQSLNRRKNVGLNTEEELAYIELIQGELQDSQYTFKAVVDKDAKSAIITKMIQPDITIKKSKSKTNISPTLQLQTALKSRVNLLEKVLNFIQSNDIEIEFQLDEDTQQQRSRLGNILSVANKVVPLKFTTTTEMVLYNKILHSMNDCSLKLVALDEKGHRVLLQKVFNQQSLSSGVTSKQQSTDDVIVDNDSIDDDDDYQIVDDEKDSDDSEKIPENNNNYIIKLDRHHDELLFQNDIDKIENSNSINNVNKTKLQNGAVNNKFDNNAKNYEKPKAIANFKIDIKDSSSSQFDEDIRSLEAIRNSDSDVNVKHVNNKETKPDEFRFNFNLDSSPTNSKRIRTESQNSEELLTTTKKNKNSSNDHIICITSKNFPKEGISMEMVRELQYMIAIKMDTTAFVPLLQCHGLKKGTLVYGCRDKQTSLWLEHLIQNSNLNIHTIACNDDIYEVKTQYDMEIKINTFIPLDVQQILMNLEVFNIGLDTSKWKVKNETFSGNCLIILVTLDDESYNIICAHDFTLYAGVDKALFRLHW